MPSQRRDTVFESPRRTGHRRHSGSGARWNAANTNAYTHLAVLYASAGRAQEAVAVLRSMVERNDSPLAYIEAVRTLGDPQSCAGRSDESGPWSDWGGGLMIDSAR